LVATRERAAPGGRGRLRPRPPDPVAADALHQHHPLHNGRLCHTGRFRDCRAPAWTTWCSTTSRKTAWCGTGKPRVTRAGP